MMAMERRWPLAVPLDATGLEDPNGRSTRRVCQFAGTGGDGGLGRHAARRPGGAVRNSDEGEGRGAPGTRAPAARPPPAHTASFEAAVRRRERTLANRC